jgi:hypothetical protein
MRRGRASRTRAGDGLTSRHAPWRPPQRVSRGSVPRVGAASGQFLVCVKAGVPSAGRHGLRAKAPCDDDVGATGRSPLPAALSGSLMPARRRDSLARIGRRNGHPEPGATARKRPRTAFSTFPATTPGAPTRALDAGESQEHLCLCRPRVAPGVSRSCGCLPEAGAATDRRRGPDRCLAVPRDSRCATGQAPAP